LISTAVGFLQLLGHSYLELVYGTDEDVEEPGEDVPLIAELLVADPPADKDKVEGGVGLETMLPSVPEAEAVGDRAVGVPGGKRLCTS
jgi:hypothetical protein